MDSDQAAAAGAVTGGGVGTAVRAVRATATGRGTHSVPELRRLVEGALAAAFPHRVWVGGRVAERRDVAAAGLEFTLTASTDAEEPLELLCLLPALVLPGLAEVLARDADAEVDDLVVPGRLLRAGGVLRYDAARGTLVLAVSDLDPAPTARGLLEERLAARALVHERDLPSHQRGLQPRLAPLDVAVVGGDDDPAVDDVRARLAASPFAVQVRVSTVPLHGREAPVLLGQAVREAAVSSDVVLLVRRTGRPLGLAVLDADDVVFAIGHAPVPVVTALGGLGETTAADEVAHVALGAAPEAAQWLLDRLASAAAELDDLAAEVRDAGRGALQRARADLDAARDAAQQEAATAAARAEAVRARTRTRLLAWSGVLAVVLVVAAVATGARLLLLGLVPLVLVLAGAYARTRWASRAGGRAVGRQDEDFSEVLEELRAVREQLSTTSSPEVVQRLRATADALVERGEQVLGEVSA